LSLTSGNLPAFADGVGSGGGGDIQCDNLIQNLTFQDPLGNLESWLRNHGPEKQNPKLDLSSTLNLDTEQPYTSAEYEKAMITLIKRFKKTPDVNCVRPGDKGYPVDVNDTSKICKTSVDEKGVHMTCDRNLFMGLTPDEQIEQDHHEFAINIPGLEPDSGSISTYRISTQLADSIATVPERRLVIKGLPVTQVGFESKSILPTDSSLTRYEWPFVKFMTLTGGIYHETKREHLSPNSDTAAGFCASQHQSLIEYAYTQPTRILPVSEDFPPESSGVKMNALLDADGSYFTSMDLDTGMPVAYVICR
jgi:hypothetical protein